MRHGIIKLLSLCLVFTVVTTATYVITGKPTAPASLDALKLPERVDLGLQRYGDSASYRFIIENDDPRRPLRIDRVASACACTTTATSPVTLRPGERREITGALRFPLNIPHSAETPAELEEHARTRWSVQMHFQVADQARTSILEAQLVSPASVDLSLETTSIRIHPIYRDALVELRAFLLEPDRELELMPQPPINGAPRFALNPAQLPEGEAGVELVLTLRAPTSEPDGDTSYKLVQQIAITGLRAASA